MSIVEALRLDRWQDEDEPTRTWWERLLAREEYVVQEGSTRWETDYKRNPHYSTGTVVTWFRWGLGIDLEVDPWYGPADDRNAESTADLRVSLGPLTAWVSRRSTPNRPNVWEPWRQPLAPSSPSRSDSSSERGSSSGG